MTEQELEALKEVERRAFDAYNQAQTTLARAAAQVDMMHREWATARAALLDAATEVTAG